MYSRILLSILFSVSLLFGHAQGNLTFGGHDNDIGYALTRTYSDGYLLVGTTRSFGEGSEDIYIIELDKNFNTNYSTTLGFLHRDVIRSVIRVNDGYIMGGDQWDFGMARSDLSIQKIDLNGNIIWRNSFGTHYTERGFDVIANKDNGYYVLGYSRGYEPRGDIFLVKTDNSGNEIWRNNYGFDHDDYAFEMLEDDNGDVLVIGSMNSFFDDVHANYKIHDADILLLKINSGGGLIWTHNYGGINHDFGYSIESAEDGGYYLVGSSQSFGEGKFDVILLKIDEAGELEWQKTYGGEGYDYGLSTTVNVDNELYITGTTKSFGKSADIYLIKTTDDGESLWSINLGGDGFDSGYDVISVEGGGCVVVGKIGNPETGKSNMVLFKISTDGFIEDITDVDIITENDSNITFGPNPMREDGSFFNKNENTYEVILINSQGQTVRSIIIGRGQTNFNRNSLPAGLYVYSVKRQEGSKIEYTGKLIIH